MKSNKNAAKGRDFWNNFKKISIAWLFVRLKTTFWGMRDTSKAQICETRGKKVKHHNRKRLNIKPYFPTWCPCKAPYSYIFIPVRRLNVIHCVKWRQQKPRENHFSSFIFLQHNSAKEWKGFS